MVLPSNMMYKNKGDFDDNLLSTICVGMCIAFIIFIIFSVIDYINKKNYKKEIIYCSEKYYNDYVKYDICIRMANIKYDHSNGYCEGANGSG